MRAMPRVVPLMLSILVLLAACGGTGGQTPAGAEDGLVVSLNTHPAAPAIGNVELVVEVKDAANRPVSGATVTLKADMIGHSMGDLSGQATDQGNGRYATTANLSMAGAWQVDVEVKTAGGIARREFRIEVD